MKIGALVTKMKSSSSACQPLDFQPYRAGRKGIQCAAAENTVADVTVEIGRGGEMTGVVA